MRCITRMLLPALVVLCLAESPVTSGDPGSSAVPGLKIGAGARASALGYAYIAESGDVYSIDWNPAGLADLAHTEIAASHSLGIADIDLTYLAGATPMGSLVVGASINYMDFGDAGPRYQIGGANNVNPVAAGGILEPKAYTVSLSGAGKLGDQLSVGGTLKVLNVDLVDKAATAFAADLGAIYRISDPFQVGLSVRNIGTDLKFYTESEQLPTTVSLGAKYRVGAMPLTVLGDVEFPNDNEIGGHVGVEYVLKDMIALRLGYSSTFDAGNGLAGGVGVQFQDWRLDYSIQSTDSDFDNIHKFSLSKIFGTTYKDRVAGRSGSSGLRKGNGGGR